MPKIYFPTKYFGNKGISTNNPDHKNKWVYIGDSGIYQDYYNKDIDKLNDYEIKILVKRIYVDKDDLNNHNNYDKITRGVRDIYYILLCITILYKEYNVNDTKYMYSQLNDVLKLFLSFRGKPEEDKTINNILANYHIIEINSIPLGYKLPIL